MRRAGQMSRGQLRRAEALSVAHVDKLYTALDAPPKDFKELVKLFADAVLTGAVPAMKRVLRQMRRSSPGKWQYRRTRS